MCVYVYIYIHSHTQISIFKYVIMYTMTLSTAVVDKLYTHSAYCNVWLFLSIVLSIEASCSQLVIVQVTSIQCR